MKIKIAAAAPDCRPGDVEQNRNRILDCVARARNEGAAFLLLPPHTLDGLAGDPTDFPLLKNAIQTAEAQLRAAFDGFMVYPFAAEALSWDTLKSANREDILLCSADRPATVQSEKENEEFCAAQSREKQCVVALATPKSGSAGDRIYTGHCVIAQNGIVLTSGEGYVCAEINSEENLCSAIRSRKAEQRSRKAQSEIYPSPKNPWLPDPNLLPRVLELQTFALARRLESVHAEKAVVGVSGGLDSTLALVAAVKAIESLGRSPRDVITVTMPCFGTTSRTRSNAEIISERLGTEFRTIDIKEAVELHLRDIGHTGNLNNAYENAQARERTQILMDIANDTRGIVVGTGDLSEIALGWCTYNGDHMSMYNVNAGLPKTAIRLVLKHYASTCGDRQLAAAIRDIIDMPITPELLPAQTNGVAQPTEELIGPYELHDFFLYYFLRDHAGPKELLDAAQEAFGKAYDRETIRRWLDVFFRRFFASQFKRSCSPEGPAVFGLSLSPRGGFFMPSDMSGQLWLQALKEA